MTVSGNSLVRTKVLFLRLVSLCYIAAFVSLYLQIPGLYGPDGVLPVYMVLSKLEKGTNLMQIAKQMAEKPSLILASPYVKIAPDHLMEILCLLGTGIAMITFIFPKCANKLNFFAMWIYYLSIYQVGQTFMWFQWDILLLEVGFLCILVSHWPGSSHLKSYGHDEINMMLVRWLLFRMMVSSGIVKLTSWCPTWWGLSALPLHYESQCLPTPLAWFAHRYFPDIIHQMSVISTYVIEIPLTFLFFAPTQGLRKFTWVAQVFLMFTIMATGNYNFFNFLYIALCISLMDDTWLKSKSQQRSKYTKMLLFIFNLLVVAIILVLTCYYFFRMKFANGEIDFTPEIQFSRAEFTDFVTKASRIGVVVGGMSLASSVFMGLYKTIFQSNGGNGLFSLVYNLSVTLIYAVIACQIFLASVPIFSRGLGEKTPEFLPKPNDFVTRQVDKFSLVSSYGLFRRMTGVGGRPEIVLEGADSRTGPWKEIEFLYKPGNISVAPKFCLPHQPRLDWQMWFAALGTAQQNPWVLSLMYRILQNKPDVIDLLDKGNYPFRKQPPKLLRAKLYNYHFSDITDNNGTWWSREEKSEYLPLFSVDHEPLVDYLEKSGILSKTKPVPKTSYKPLRKFLKLVRKTARKFNPEATVWTATWVLLSFTIFF